MRLFLTDVYVEGVFFYLSSLFVDVVRIPGVLVREFIQSCCQCYYRCFWKLFEDGNEVVFVMVFVCVALFGEVFCVGVVCLFTEYCCCCCCCCLYYRKVGFA